MLQTIKKLSKIPFIIIRELVVGLVHAPDKDKRGAFDTVDPRDFQYREVFGTQVELPESHSLIHKLSKKQNQTLKSKTRMYCTPFSVSQGADIMEGENLKTYKTGEEFGDLAVAMKLLNPKTGAYLIDIVKLAKKVGLIDGFTRVTTNREMQEAITNGFYIYGGSNKTDWRETRRTGFFTLGTSYGHCFGFAGFDKVGFDSVDSDGSDGYKLKYEDAQKILFPSKYALHINSENLNKLLELIKYFKDGLANGEQLVNLYTKIPAKDRRKYDRVIQLALRKATGKVIKKSDLI